MPNRLLIEGNYKRVIILILLDNQHTATYSHFLLK